MITLTYISTANKPFSVVDLAELLDSARVTNQAIGLTGILIYAGGRFMQTLEGPAAVVDEMFARIARDPRHHDVVVSQRDRIPARTFPDWSMGFEKRTRRQASDLPGFDEYVARMTDSEGAGC